MLVKCVLLKLDELRLSLTVLLCYSHVSPFLFTKTLLPILVQTAKEPGSDVRVVMVSVLHRSVLHLSITQCGRDIHPGRLRHYKHAERRRGALP